MGKRRHEGIQERSEDGIMSKTKKPTGLGITRSGNSFTVSWKRGDNDYGDGQQLQWRLSCWGAGVWASESVGASALSKAISITLSSLYPSSYATAGSITVRVRGNRKKYKKSGKKINPGWSDWAQVAFAFTLPNKPVLSVELDEELSNVSTFSWTVDRSDSSNQYYRDVEWQSILVPNCKETDGSKLSWNSNAIGWQTAAWQTTATKTITEDTELLADSSCTRWFRARARGIVGPTDWVYAKQVYARPYQAQVISTSAEENGANGFTCETSWEATENAANPIDKTTVQYAIATPAAGLACPSGASWTDANISKDTAGTDKAAFSIDNTLSEDECLFIRVNTKHDGNITYGNPTLSAVGNLKDPTGVSVSTDNTTHRATINATNASSVADSFLVVEYRTESKPAESFICGVIPNGQSTVTVQCPDWSDETAFGFGVRAVVGSATEITRADGASCYSIVERMRSANTVWKGGTVPQAPGNVNAAPTDIAGTIRVTWNWSWADANCAEISWSDHIDAWESTDQPGTYMIENLHAAQWNISGLETGKKWYIRVRLVNKLGTDSITYGPWSDPVVIDLSSAPSVPVLALSAATITEDGSVVASWAYSTTDGTQQAYAELCEAEIDAEGITYGDVIAHTQTAQHITINAPEAGWQAGETHGLCVRVISASGKASDAWSDPVFVHVATPLTAAITSTSLVNKTVPNDDDANTTRTQLSLTEMPLTATVTGAGNGGETILSIERAEEYRVVRPDDKMQDGQKGEVVAEIVQMGESQITIGKADLYGHLDDGARYLLRATIRDDFGQSAEATLEFEVHWDHQALIPGVQIQMDQAEYAAFITPIAPDGAEEGDTVDIYRLSTDPPELIVSGGTFGTKYVDPFPAIGETGGHRIVFKTSNGDYITEDGRIAWIDTGYDDYDCLESDYNIIDFDNEQILFVYNTDVTNSWEKDFKRTSYLAGSVQGDWNPAITRDANVDTVILVEEDAETIRAMRRLAEFPGICHIRTKDGSSFPADIQVQEGVRYSEGHKLASYTLNIARIGSEGHDGLPYEEWR